MPHPNFHEDITVSDGNSPITVLSYMGDTNGAIALGDSYYNDFEAVTQKLVATSSFLIEQVSVIMAGSGGPTDNVILRIYADGSNGDNGNLVSTAVVNGTGLTYPPVTVFTLFTPVNIVSGHTYWFTFTRGDANTSRVSYYLSRSYTDNNANSLVYGKYAPTGVWYLQSSSYQKQIALSLEYISGGLTIQLVPDEPKIIFVSENVIVSDRVTFDINLNVFETVTVTDVIADIHNGTRSISVYDSATVTDEIPNPLMIIKAGGVTSTNRYWVGGSGRWDDSLMWSDTSGGDPGVPPPDGTTAGLGNVHNYYNKVYFDENSFDSDDSTVTLIGTIIYCGGIDMTGVDQTFSFIGSSKIYTYTSTILSDKFTSSESSWYLWNGGVSTFYQNGANMDTVTYFLISGASTANLGSDIVMPNADFTVAASAWTSNTLTFNTNDYDLTVLTYVQSGGASDPLSIFSSVSNFGTSTVNTSGFLVGGSTFVGYGVTFNGANTTINFTPTGMPGHILSADNYINTSHSGLGGTVSFGTINVFNGGPGTATAFSGYGMVPWNLSGDLTIEAGSTIYGGGYDASGRITVAGTFTANGEPGNMITINGTGAQYGSGGKGEIYAAVSSTSYINVSNSVAGGTGAPFDNTNGGVDSGGNSNWQFLIVWPVDPVHEHVTVTEFVNIVVRPLNCIMYQLDIPMVHGKTYDLFCEVLNANGYPIYVYIGDNYSGTNIATVSIIGDDNIDEDFVWNGVSGNYQLSFYAGDSPFFMGEIDTVSLKGYVTNPSNDNISVKEFLTGQTDEGREIFFRADTQQIQLQSQFETFSNPMAIVTRLQRGTMLKCFVALDDGDFYEIEGTASKGVSILKVHSKNRSKIPTPPIARKMRVSWRDGSKQLCRLIQTAIIFIPGTMDYSE